MASIARNNNMTHRIATVRPDPGRTAAAAANGEIANAAATASWATTTVSETSPTRITMISEATMARTAPKSRWAVGWWLKSERSSQPAASMAWRGEFGRASGRERGWQTVYISVVDVSFNTQR